MNELEKFTRAALNAGFEIYPDELLTLSMRKEYETINGLREATLTIFPARNNYVSPSYDSEGQNILQAHDIHLIEGTDHDTAIKECEKLINESYARKIHLGSKKLVNEFAETYSKLSK